jgi:signal peptidase I
MNEFLKVLLKTLPIIIIVAIFSSQIVAVPTDSMTPVINSGDMVLVQKTDVLGVFSELNPEDVKEGDIIIYSKNSDKETVNEDSGHGEGNSEESKESIIHRVVEVKTSQGQKYLILKGDNNLEVDDEMVYPSQITAKAIMWGENPVIIPQLGNIIIFFKNIIHSFTSLISGGG